MKLINSSGEAILLPTSPHESKNNNSNSSGDIDLQRTEDLISTWDKVLHASSFLNNPLLPFREWNVDFSELTVGPCVGIGFFGEVFRAYGMVQMSQSKFF